MKIGTKSVLYGYHCFFIHPWFVALAWWRLYGFPLDPRLWVAFFIHDIGYWGKPNMDGPEGETHPEVGADFMARFFGMEWCHFVLYHSRFYAKRAGVNPSRLCVADKYAYCLTPSWLIVTLVRLTGEVLEYRALADSPSYSNPKGKDDWEWCEGVKVYCRKYVADHKDDQTDNVTVARSH